MNTRSITQLVLMLGLCVIGSADAQVSSPEKSNYEIGVQAFKDGDYRAAFDAWSLGAYEENPEAQYNLGVLYLEGRGVERDLEQARNWFLKAANKNQIEAQYNLGHMALSGLGMEKDTNEALRWWQKASTGGYPQAQFNYGRALYLGIGGKQDITEGLRLIRLAASQQDKRAQEFLDTSAEEIAEVEQTKVTVAPKVQSDAPKPKAEPEQLAKSMQKAELASKEQAVVKPAQNTITGQKPETPRKSVKLAPKKPAAVQTGSVVQEAPTTQKPARKRDQIATNNQVAAQEHDKSDEKVSVERKPTPKSAPASQAGQGSVVQDNRVVALDPLPADKGESTTSTNKREVPVSENLVIALDKPEPVEVQPSKPVFNEDTMIEPARPRQEAPQSELESRVQIVRDTSPIQRDYFLRTVNSPVKVYAQADKRHELDTLLPRTLVKVIAKQGSNLQIEIAPGLPAWVKRVEVKLQDGYASAAQNSVRLYTQPDGMVIGELPTEFKSLIIEQRRKWLKLRVPQSIYGWIDGHALADSGETAHELMVEWVRSTHAVIGAAKRGDDPVLPQPKQIASMPTKLPETLSGSSETEVSSQKSSSASDKIIVLPVEQQAVPATPHVVAAEPTNTSNPSATEKVLASSAPVEGHPINDNKWLFSQPQGAYLIHLFTVLDHERAKKVAQHESIRDLARLYTTRIKDEDWSFVLLGAYPDEQAAQNALKALPKAYTRHARARLVSLLASNRCKKQNKLSADQAKDLVVLCP